MKLKMLKLTNFRGYKDVIIGFSDEMSLIIGRNDVGKSTIMDALEIFFNGENRTSIVRPEVDDCNIYALERYFEITCIFEIDHNKPIYIDATHSTSFSEEYLLNKDGYLEISKRWNCKNASLNQSSLSVSLKANYPKISNEPLILKKNTDLQKEIQLYKDSIIEYENVNKSTNSIMRKALYNHLISSVTEFEEVMIEIKKVETAGEKDVWKKLKENLPLFFLFQSDRSNSDSDGEVQNPLKIATKKALAEMQDKLEEIKKSVESIVSKIGDETIEKLKEFDTDIASNLKTNLNLKAWDSIFSFDLTSDDNIPLNKRGSGIRRLILLSYFRAEAERISKEKNLKQIIYAIEEPETAQHPDYQKMILESLNIIAEDGMHQVILTTHTPEIAKLVDINNIIFIQKTSRFPEVIEEQEQKIYKIAQSLGILPTIQSKVVICVEGENDVNFLMNLNQSIPEFKQIIDLKVNDISIIPLSGGKLINWINNNYLSNSNVLEYHLYDSDVEKYIEKIQEITYKNDGRRFGRNTILREMENYIPSRVVAEQFKIDVEEYISSWTNMDLPKHLINICMTNIPDAKEREKVIKVRLNGQLTKLITKEDLDQMDTYDEMEKWFKEISNLYHYGCVSEEQTLVR